MLVEVCANSLESALNAEKAGAHRVELCSELGVGGITPSYGLIQLVRDKLSIPVHVLIRPRSAHFTYSDLEFEVMLKDIEFCVDIGVDGIVSGVLHTDATVDLIRTKKLIEKSRPLHFTFHRAFDWIEDQERALEGLKGIEVDTVLTSGKQVTVEKGMEPLKKLNDISENIVVMPGGGVNANNAEKFKEAGFKALHLSGTSFKNQVSIKEKISMNSAKHLIEDEVAVTNMGVVRQIVQIAK